MALIVAVHGIGQQFKADTVIHAEWLPSLRGGLHLAGGDLKDDADLACAFYGYLFRKKGKLSAGMAAIPANLDTTEIALLNLLWEEAAVAEPGRVPAPGQYAGTATMAATPQVVQRALNALAKSSFFAGIAEHMMIGNLKQVVSYFEDSHIREQAVALVRNLLSDDTRVVVGHSLGSVVAYEALCQGSHQVNTFLSIGSPLGIQNLIFQRLRPAPSALGVGQWPGAIRYWTNIADRGDVVANPKQLQPFFGGELQDIPVNNGSDAHHGERYLTAIESGAAIWRGLTSV